MTASCVCERRAGGGMGGIMAARGRRCQCLEGMGKWDSGEEFPGEGEDGPWGFGWREGILGPMFRFFPKITSEVVSKGFGRARGGWPQG